MEGCSGYLPISRLSCLHFCNVVPCVPLFSWRAYAVCSKTQSELKYVFFKLMSRINIRYNRVHRVHAWSLVMMNFLQWYFYCLEILAAYFYVSLWVSEAHFAACTWFQFIQIFFRTRLFVMYPRTRLVCESFLIASQLLCLLFGVKDRTVFLFQRVEHGRKCRTSVGRARQAAKFLSRS